MIIIIASVVTIVITITAIVTAALSLLDVERQAERMLVLKKDGGGGNPAG